jgi:hypothetical protein
MRPRLALLLLLPLLLGFDGSHAREALDLAFHNLYGSDILAGVELAIEGPREASSVEFAFGRKRSGDETRMLVYGTDGARDTPRALLFQRPDGNDRIFISDGPHGAVRPMSAGKRAWSLFGSDFAYEDLRAQRADDYRIEVLGTDEIDGEPCRVLRLRPFHGPYRSILIWLSSSRPVIVRADYFDARGLWKRYTAVVDEIAFARSGTSWSTWRSRTTSSRRPACRAAASRCSERSRWGASCKRRGSGARSEPTASEARKAGSARRDPAGRGLRRRRTARSRRSRRRSGSRS